MRENPGRSQRGDVVRRLRAMGCPGRKGAASPTLAQWKTPGIGRREAICITLERFAASGSLAGGHKVQARVRPPHSPVTSTQSLISAIAMLQCSPGTRMIS